MGIDHIVMHPLFIGPFVLILNTSAYAAEIFYGALRSLPKGEMEAAQAFGMSRWQIFKTVTWPNILRLAWPAYTNEVVFLFHATALVYFTLSVSKRSIQPMVARTAELVNDSDSQQRSQSCKPDNQEEAINSGMP